MNDVWVVKDADGNVTNAGVSADEAFMQTNFEYYEAFVEPEVPALTAEQEARQWRDIELNATDKASQTPDWPNRDNIILYRAALRDWPSTADFPDTKPTLGE